MSNGTGSDGLGKPFKNRLNKHGDLNAGFVINPVEFFSTASASILYRLIYRQWAKRISIW